MTTYKLQTVTLSTGETVLAKIELTTNPDAIIPQGNRQAVPLRYGNETAAKKKLDSIQPLLAPSRSASIVKQDGRFLIFIYDKPRHQTTTLKDACDSVNQALDQAVKSTREFIIAYASKRPPFTTTTGRRQNPRNRHNHAHKDQTDKPYYFGE